MVVLATILIVAAVITAIAVVLHRLGEVSLPRDLSFGKSRGVAVKQRHLFVFIRDKIRMLLGRVWHFILEAKDLKPATGRVLQDQMEKVKNVFRIRIRSTTTDPHWLPEAVELDQKQVSINPEDMYLAAIKKDANDRNAYEALGRLYLQNKNFADATETFLYLAKLDPNKDIYFSNLGLAYYSTNEFKKAAAVYEKAITLNSKIPTRWANLSLCYLAMEDYPRAIKALTSALALDKTNIGYLMMLADTYLRVPNQVRAEEVLEQILSLDPTHKPAREKLMKIRI